MAKNWDGSVNDTFKALEIEMLVKVVCCLELLDRLAALIPPPRQHRVRYYGVLAPHSALREAVIATAGPGAARQCAWWPLSWTRSRFAAF